MHHEITTEKLIYFGLIFLVSFTSCFFRTLRDADFRDIWHVLSLSVCAGFLAFGVCAVCDGLGAVRIVGGTGGLGISALLGLVAKEQDKFGRAVLFKALAGMRNTLDSINDQYDEPAKVKKTDSTKPD